MVEIKRISEARLNYLAGEKGFNILYLEKDYFLTLLLFFLKDIDGLHFKGGTALNKIFLNHRRLSEDLDFTCNKPINETKAQILKIIEEQKELFPKAEFLKQTPNYSRIKVFYNSYQKEGLFLFIDINSKASVLLKPKKQKVPHFYEEIPGFESKTLDVKELVAEKIRALITRRQPRDYFDAYTIIHKQLKIDLPLVKKKLKEAGQEFSVERIFKNANKIYRGWDSEIGSLTNEPIEYKTAITAIAKHFKYKKKKKRQLQSG